MEALRPRLSVTTIGRSVPAMLTMLKSDVIEMISSTILGVALICVHDGTAAITRASNSTSSSSV